MSQRDAGPADFNPKHRIVGAVILVSLAIIFVPMIFDRSEPPSELKIEAEIPKRKLERETPDSKFENKTESKVLVSPVTAVPPAAPDKTTPGGKSPPEKGAEKKETPPPAPAAAPLEQKKIAPAKTKPAASPERSAKPAVEAKPDKGWVVQVGTFAQEENADRLVEKLKEHGYTVGSENIKLEGRSAVRLRVGPYREKSAAMKAQAQIRRQVGVQGVVLSYP